MARTYEHWTTTGLLDHFVDIHRRMPDRAFAFVLGAGASRSSGIPTGGELVSTWIAELQRRLDPEYTQREPRDWATAETLDIPGFTIDEAASFYPEVFDRRFSADAEEGYAALESLMDGKEPSFGYSVLAQILATTRHRVVVTTNFDNLVADALSIYTRTYPLVCGHESLTHFVRARMRRPLVAKIHRDLLMAPINDAEGVSELAPGWKAALSHLFQSYTPVFLGYGGNDGSLMGLLESMFPGDIVGGLLWCYRAEDGLPGERIRKVVARHRGALVPVVGFDEFMFQLGQKLGLGFVVADIARAAERRLAQYRRAVERSIGRLARLPHDPLQVDRGQAEVRLAVARSIERLDGWWAWELRALMEADPQARRETYKLGLVEFPDSADLHGRYANFLKRDARTYDQAEAMYRRALALAPDNASHIGNFANFMKTVREDYVEAERLYRRALALDPENATHTGNFANFLKNVADRPDEAEALYRRALDLDPSNAMHTGNYATFLWRVRGRPDEAERLYRKALLLDPRDPGNCANYAALLLCLRRLPQAERWVHAGWAACNDSGPQIQAELLLYRALILRSRGDSDDAPLAGLKALLEGEFARGPWYFGDILDAAGPPRDTEDRALYDAVAQAILDPDARPALDALPRWGSLPVRPYPTA